MTIIKNGVHFVCGTSILDYDIASCQAELIAIAILLLFVRQKIIFVELKSILLVPQEAAWGQGGKDIFLMGVPATGCSFLCTSCS
jgi:hypothetical protein